MVYFSFMINNFAIIDSVIYIAIEIYKCTSVYLHYPILHFVNASNSITSWMVHDMQNTVVNMLQVFGTFFNTFLLAYILVYETFTESMKRFKDCDD